MDFPLLNRAVRELAELRQWLLWRQVTREGKPTKIPLQATGRPASVSDASTWTSFDAAFGALQKGEQFAGLGFVLTEADPYTAIDLDRCVRGGKLDPEAQRLVDEMASYTEWSPSGTGVHIWVRARLPGGGGRRKGGVEVYTSRRYMTVTGKRVEGTPPEIAERQEALAKVVSREIGDEPGQPQEDDSFAGGVGEGMLPGVKFAALLLNDRKFKRTWERSRPDLENRHGRRDDSVYDAALLKIAADAGWSDEELAGLLVAYAREIGPVRAAKVLRRDSRGRLDYVERTITFVRQAQGGGISDNDLQDEAISRGTDERLEEAAAEGRLLEELSVDLGFPVSRVIRRGTTAQYHLEISGPSGDLVSVQIGTIGHLIGQTAVRNAVAERTGLLMRRFKPARWDAIVVRLLSAAESESVGEGDSPEQMALEVLREHFDDVAPQEPEDADALYRIIAKGAPFVRDGRIHVHSGWLSEQLKIMAGEGISRARVCHLLRSLKGEATAVNATVKDGQKTTRYWSLPGKLLSP